MKTQLTKILSFKNQKKLTKNSNKKKKVEGKLEG